MKFRMPSESPLPCPPPNLVPDRTFYAAFYDCMAGLSAQPPFELHSVDLATWDDGVWADPIFSRRRPEDLDEPWPYRFQASGGSLKCSTTLIIWFQSGQDVWIHASDGAWYLGKVVGQVKRGRTRVEMVGI